ncbi:hypothetical protein K3725_11550 [Leisingera sp. S132]|uniref:hypothetical protein n=1 Tax=Leisingera sp. S132 TaxID=2867016 RepID=UPI0021A53E48|nr:hypothetical protein [Leisingera sp. S132]UWQ77952.1 hypothetical protein K3725_11550 [Leisingera sp. S132]
MAKCDDPLQRCFQGNLFRADMPRSNVIIEGAVNGIRTGPLPSGEVFKLENTLRGTTGRADLYVGGKQFPIIDDLDEFNISKPEDVGMAVSEIPPPKSQGGNQVHSNAEVEDALVLQVPPSLVASAPALGDFDVDTAPEEALLWIATVVVTSLEVIDEGAGLTGLYEWSKGHVDLQLSGTDSTPVLAELANLILQNDIRNGMRAILRGGGGLIKVGMNAGGVMFVAFRHSRSLGIFVSGTAAALARSRANTIVAGVKGSLSRTAEGVRGVPLIGFVIVGTLDFLEWYADPDRRGDWSDLMAVLLVDMAALTISTIAGGLAAAAAATALSAVASTVAGVVIIAAVGILAGLAVGMIATGLSNAVGLTPLVERGLERVARGAVAVMEFTADLVDDAVDFATHATPRDGRVTGPTDYLMEIDRGLMDYINSRLRMPSF